MNKLVNNLNVRDYECVEDIIGELLQDQHGIIELYFESLERGVEYIVGSINIVKLGNRPNTLKHKHDNEWTEDIEVSESYRDATYYELKAMNKLCENVLRGTWSEPYNLEQSLKLVSEGDVINES